MKLWDEICGSRLDREAFLKFVGRIRRLHEKVKDSDIDWETSEVPEELGRVREMA